MTFPNPPGENVPLYDGLSSDWNDIVSAFPEDKRNELAPLLKSRLDSIEEGYKPLKQWEDLAKSGVTPEHASTALNLYSIIDTDPKQVYDVLAKHLNITPAQAEEVVEAVEEGDESDPRIQQMQHKIDTLMQIELAKHQQSTTKQREAEAEAAIDKALNDLKKKHGDFDEEQIVMRMLHKNMKPEDAYMEYTNMVSELKKRPLTPMLLGGGGGIPKPGIDVRKLDGKATRSLVAQMMIHDNNERKA
jgi:hypothetical protein